MLFMDEGTKVALGDFDSMFRDAVHLQPAGMSHIAFLVYVRNKEVGKNAKVVNRTRFRVSF